MNWDRVNVWTNTFYTLIHVLELARQDGFGDLATVNENILSSEHWISPDCSYSSVLLAHPFGGKRIEFRRDPNVHFNEISSQIVKMLIQDLTVILDDMMGESLRSRGENVPNFPQSKIEKLSTFLNKAEYEWSSHGCLELVAVRNVLTHSNGSWNLKSINIVNGFVSPAPTVDDPLVVGVKMLFRYRKAMRTFLNETKFSS